MCHLFTVGCARLARRAVNSDRGVLADRGSATRRPRDQAHDRSAMHVPRGHNRRFPRAASRSCRRFSGRRIAIRRPAPRGPWRSNLLAGNGQPCSPPRACLQNCRLRPAAHTVARALTNERSPPAERAAGPSVRVLRASHALAGCSYSTVEMAYSCDIYVVTIRGDILWQPDRAVRETDKNVVTAQQGYERCPIVTGRSSGRHAFTRVTRRDFAWRGMWNNTCSAVHATHRSCRSQRKEAAEGS